MPEQWRNFVLLAGCGHFLHNHIPLINLLTTHLKGLREMLIWTQKCSLSRYPNLQERFAMRKGSRALWVSGEGTIDLSLRKVLSDVGVHVHVVQSRAETGRALAGGSVPTLWLWQHGEPCKSPSSSFPGWLTSGFTSMCSKEAPRISLFHLSTAGTLRTCEMRGPRRYCNPDAFRSVIMPCRSEMNAGAPPGHRKKGGKGFPSGASRHLSFCVWG